MGRQKKEVKDEVVIEDKKPVRKVKADVMPACPVCGSEAVKHERKTIYKCLACNNRFQ
jgi:ribosomal protein L37AE/L43A